MGFLLCYVVLVHCSMKTEATFGWISSTMFSLGIYMVKQWFFGLNFWFSKGTVILKNVEETAKILFRFQLYFAYETMDVFLCIIVSVFLTFWRIFRHLVCWHAIFLFWVLFFFTSSARWRLESVKRENEFRVNVTVKKLHVHHFVSL